MDHGVLVYKIDNPVQSSLLSSLVLTLIQDSFTWSTLKSCDCNISPITFEQVSESSSSLGKAGEVNISWYPQL